MKRLLPFLISCGTCFLSGAQTSSLTRVNDPVIISGADLSFFSVINPDQIVGFKYVSGTWSQIPVQVDERALLDIVTPYGALAGTGVGYLPPAPSPNNPKIYFYCDAATNIGVDPVATFDSDDELVFMAKDAGGMYTGTNYPAGVVQGSCQQVAIYDTMSVDTGYIYLFKNLGLLQQNAGVNYITYTSNLSTTTGFPANNNVTNAENTTITTSKYAWHFMSEWVSDELKLLAGNGVDILDRHKAFFANGSIGCGRHEELFSSGENAFIVCKAGPVRVIRSYMGAQSGPLTQRTHFFYDGRHDLITNLRVHYIPSIYDAFDYNPAANGMIYRNSLNTSGVTIDGTTDVVAAGSPQWEQVSGTPGTLSIINRITTDLTSATATFTGYYDDNSTTPASNCTGTQGAWGTSGLGIQFASNICTDCYGNSNFRSLQLQKTVYADAPNLPATTASNYSKQIDKPFKIVTSACQATTPTGISTNNSLLENSTLFPNPSNGKISIQGLEAGTSLQISIFNLYGQLVDTITLNENQTSFIIHEAGIYEVLMVTEKGIKTQKVLVVK